MQVLSMSHCRARGGSGPHEHGRFSGEGGGQAQGKPGAHEAQGNAPGRGRPTAPYPLQCADAAGVAIASKYESDYIIQSATEHVD